MSLVLDLIILLLGFALLTKGADYFIENSASLAKEKGISPHVVGVTIVAFGTSLPELLVSIISSFQGYNDLALGNIVGSNISNIGLVLAVSTFIFFYVLNTNIVPDDDANNDSYVMLLAVILLFLFSQDKEISQAEGMLFFVLYLIYIYWLYKKSSNNKVEVDKTENTSYLLLIGGLFALLLGAQLTVDSAVSIATSIGISEIVIGLSVVAVGTSLPELAGTVSAARMGHQGNCSGECYRIKYSKYFSSDGGSSNNKSHFCGRFRCQNNLATFDTADNCSIWIYKNPIDPFKWFNIICLFCIICI